MIGLLYKNLILTKKSIITMLIASLWVSLICFVPQEDLENEMRTVILCMTCLVVFLFWGTIQQGFFAVDEKKKWADFISSTPLSYRGQVKSSYCFTLLCSLSAFLFCMLISSLSGWIYGSYINFTKICMVFCVIQILLRSVEIPFVIRFGSKNGNGFRLAIGLGFVFIAFVYALFGDLSVFSSSGDFVDLVIRLTNGEKLKKTLRVLLYVSPIICGVIFWLSYKFSCKIYMKGVENYDE